MSKSSKKEPAKSNVIEGLFGAQARREKNSRSTLCANGHHKWRILKDTQFDVKLGKLVTVLECKRCKTIKRKLV